jgi:dihydrofolate reductase
LAAPAVDFSNGNLQEGAKAMATTGASMTRPLGADLFITLDGYAEGDRSPAYFGMLGPQLENWIEREIEQPQIVVMGRVTYETFAQYDDGSGRLAKMPKILVSRTRTEASWGETEIVNSDEALIALKRKQGSPMRIMGSVSLVQRLLHARALDRLRLVVFPLVLGDTGSQPVFAHVGDLSLDLITTEVLDGRLVVLDYRPTT